MNEAPSVGSASVDGERCALSTRFTISATNRRANALALITQTGAIEFGSSKVVYVPVPSDYSDLQEFVPGKLARILPQITIGCCFDSHPRINSVFRKPEYRYGLLDNAINFGGVKLGTGVGVDKGMLSTNLSLDGTTLSTAGVKPAISLPTDASQRVEKFFTDVSISPQGILLFDKPDGVSLAAAVQEVHLVNYELYGRTAHPSAVCSSAVPDYHSDTRRLQGRVVVGVEGTAYMDHNQMVDFLGPQGLSLTPRNTSIAALGLFLFLTGQLPGGGSVELRDASGLLRVQGVSLGCQDQVNFKRHKGPTVLALAEYRLGSGW
jgi:hypothetical protein